MDNTSWNNSTWEETESPNTFDGETKYCPNCGEKLPGGAAFCPYCGFKFTGILSESAPETDMTADLHGQKDDTTYKFDNSISNTRESTSQNLYEIDTGYYDNLYKDLTPPPKKKRPLVMIIAIISAAIVALFLGFFVIAPWLGTRIVDGDDDSSTSTTTSTIESNNDDATPTPTFTPIPTATVTPIPTATPTPVPTATPTEVPPQTINQPNIIDASTGQPISIPNDTAESYAYPDSGSRVWSYGDVNGMTAGQVRYCINEIYAKHGYIFQNENWLNYFKQKTWYSPTVPKASFGDKYLNANEVANVRLLNQYYSDRKFPDY